MSLNSHLETITQIDLESLINNREAEQKTLDYKKSLNLSIDRAKDEFRADVTSFANALGGHLVIGMEEAQGFPTNLCGQDVPNIDAMKLQIDEILQSKIFPRIPGIGIHPILLYNGKWAIVIRIPRSFSKPHQITIGKDDFQFWARNSAGKYRMTVDELRSVILQSDSISERVRQFRMARIGNIAAGDTPVAVSSGAKMVLHLVPITAFDAARIDVSSIQSTVHDKQIFTLTDPNGNASFDGRFNLDGYVGYSTFHNTQSKPSYTQLFRNGILEFVDSYYLDPPRPGENPKWIYAAERALAISIRRGLQLQMQLDLTPPVVIMLSLVGAKDCTVALHRPSYLTSIEPFGQDIILLPETLAQSFNEDENKLLKPILDAVWNAGGFPSCRHFDGAGILQEPSY